MLKAVVESGLGDQWRVRIEIGSGDILIEQMGKPAAQNASNGDDNPWDEVFHATDKNRTS